MQNKKNIYFLVPATLVIWGIIGFRMYKALNPSDINTIVKLEDSTFKPSKIEITKPYTIKTNNRDPFLGTIKQKKKTTKKIKKTAIKEQILFPKIIYKGVVSPKLKNKPPIFLIYINGQQSLMKVNSSFEDIKLIAGNDKEVVLEFKKVRKTFSIQ